MVKEAVTCQLPSFCDARTQWRRYTRHGNTSSLQRKCLCWYLTHVVEHSGCSVAAFTWAPAWNTKNSSLSKQPSCLLMIACSMCNSCCMLVSNCISRSTSSAQQHAQARCAAVNKIGSKAILRSTRHALKKGKHAEQILAADRFECLGRHIKCQRRKFHDPSGQI